MAKAGMDTGQQGVIYGFNVDIPGINIEQDMVEVWFNDWVSKGFFSWVVPVDDNTVRVGMGTSRKEGYAQLEKFIQNRFGEVETPPIHGGLVCTGGSVKQTAYPGMLLVGDVAGQVKPSTGGGVVIGGLCSKIAGNYTSEYLSGGGQGALDAYDSEWRSLHGGELSTMLMFRRTLNALGDDRLNRMFRAFNTEGMGEKITGLVSDGDMDMQADVIRKAFTDPRIIAVMAKVAGRVMVGEVLSFFGF